MATTSIIVNPYEVPAGLDGSNVVTNIVKFNNNTILPYCRKFIGTNKSAKRKLIKKIATNLEDIVYTITFIFEKNMNSGAVVSYTISVPDANSNIIQSNQEYSTISEFEEDIEFINNQSDIIF